jgi:very-short-patch-repair endonuclease
MSQPLKTLDLDMLTDLCKDMTREQIYNFLLAQKNSGVQPKATARLGQILFGICRKENYTIQELRDDSPIEQIMERELLYEKIPQVRKLKFGKCELDFAIECNNWHLDIECDGYEYHYKDYKQVRRDQARDKFLTSHGWFVLRFPGTQIEKDVASCVKRIKELLVK